MKRFFGGILTLTVVVVYFSSIEAWRRRRRSCRTNCQWRSWGSYGSCSVSCGGGTQSRYRRVAVYARCGGAGCSGSTVSTRLCNRQCCPVACSWGSWGSYGSCSRSCGGGTKSRSRIHARSSRCGGSLCQGPSREVISCNTQCCPVNCRWNSWSDYGLCSLTCGGGIQVRRRSFAVSSSCGGNRCTGSKQERRNCNTQCCPVNCRWSSWGNYDSCSAICGGGIQVRERNFAVSPTCGGNRCTGTNQESRNCNTQCCPVNCRWSSWSSYGSCSATCGGGTQVRGRRFAVSPTCGGNRCTGNNEDSRNCNTECCPVDCKWNSWGEYGPCSVSCGAGRKLRHRTIQVQQSCGGGICEGENIDRKICNTNCCPVNCIWSSWSNYNSCSVFCGGGIQTRQRHIITQRSCGGTECLGTTRETKICNTECCSVDCLWSSWGPYGSCSRTCGTGSKNRSRSISFHEVCGGSSCSGPQQDSLDCNTGCCPVDCAWGSWSDFSFCSATCGGGEMERTRTILRSEKCDGRKCVGNKTQREYCNSHNCPIDCSWSEWNNWKECTVSCGKGSQSRTRTIDVQRQYGGQICYGNTTQTRSCNDVCCPVDCVWDNWESWNACSKTCERGIQSRKRNVLTHQSCGGVSCLGDVTTERTCNDICCPVDCLYSPWSSWQNCSRTCGSGRTTRRRVITVEASCGGNSCTALTMETLSCNTQPCPVHCQMTPWTHWSACSASCGPNGTEVRTRSIQTIPKFNGTDCPTKRRELQGCNRICFNGKLGRFRTTGEYYCNCNEGWSGVCCNQDVNECEVSDPCHINAVCYNTIGSFACDCLVGFSGDGKNCLNDDECEEKTHNCHLAATCKDTAGSYICECLPGYFGDGHFCEDEDECQSSSTCHAKAVCINTPGSYGCTCLSGFSGNGKVCQNINECRHSTHDCAKNAYCMDTDGSFACTCKEGYSGNGTSCYDVNECMVIDPCHINAVCNNTIGSFTCDCLLGFSGDGKNCLNDDECAQKTHNCHLAATCKDTAGSYICECLPGYFGDGQSCEDEDECQNSSTCHAKAVCINTPGSYGCTCLSGFSGNGKVCQNINECRHSTHDCAQNAYCMDTNGSFVCTCKEGYSGNGTSCYDVNECMVSDPCHINAVCNNTIGSFTCDCLHGFSGDGKNCLNNDECEEKIYNCHISATCKDTAGSYICECLPGYFGDGHYCEDVDECSDTEVSAGPCHNNAICSNAIGSYSCSCLPGFEGDGIRECQDINECTRSTHNCAPEAYCLDTDGSFSCACKEGYSGNGTTCYDVDECNDTKSSTEPCHNNATCSNTIGSYICSCLPGFEGDGAKECQDIDECNEREGSTKPCHDNAFCSNSVGAFSCTCLSGFKGDGYSKCEDVNECSELEGSGSLCHDNAMCSNTFGSHTCNCLPGFEGDGYNKCEDIDECTLSFHNCDINAVCVNGIGSFSCQCNLGYTGNGQSCLNFDECMWNVDKCHEFADCIDDEGNYTCMCKPGYSGDGFECVDIDECKEAEGSTQPCHNDADCSNAIGSYTCMCLPGYEGDGFNDCKDVDECIQTGRCEINANCVNTLGSYNCECQEGFVLNNKGECSDINECKESDDSNKKLCHENALCDNLVGGYKCSCPPGYIGDGHKKCEDVDECIEKDRCETNALCMNTQGSYQCQCKDGFVMGKDKKCLDENECERNNACGPKSQCSNTLGSYLCKCMDGFMKDSSGKCTEQTTTNLKDLSQQNSSPTKFNTKILFYAGGGLAALLVILLISFCVYKKYRRKSHTLVSGGWISHNFAMFSDTNPSSNNVDSNAIKDEDL